MNRNTFLKQSFKMGTLVMLCPLSDHLSAMAAPLTANGDELAEDDFLKRLIVANDKEVAALKVAMQNGPLLMGRKLSADFAALAASFCSPGSVYYHDALIVPELEKIIRFLAGVQSVDGTLNFNNLESPPDTAFLLEALVPAAGLLENENLSILSALNERVKKFILKSGEAMVKGGVHTPNHRWVISAVLAQLNAYSPDKRYTERAEDWLGEGVYIDEDGHFSERSINYAYVECNGLTTIGRLLNKPELLNAVRSNLKMTYYYMEPSGDLVTTDSRRQDQYSVKSIIPFYLLYRYFAILDNDRQFAGITRLIEQMNDFDEKIISRSLCRVLTNPLLKNQLPPAPKPSTEYEKLFTTSGLLRIRRGDKSSTLFGGVDRPLIIASGRSNSPNLYSFRNGNAILKYLRLSADFFSTGYFYSEGIKRDGNKYILHQKLEVPYYQPLPKEHRNPAGDYALSMSVDGRFWNKMDFENRPVSNIKTLETTIVFFEKDGRNHLTFQIAGAMGVPVTIEMCFKEGGRLTGVIPAGDDNNFMETGLGSYEFEGDLIRFGPGAATHKVIKGLEGEKYSTHFGSLRTEGMHVYITGSTPFNHTLMFS